MFHQSYGLGTLAVVCRYRWLPVARSNCQYCCVRSRSATTNCAQATFSIIRRSVSNTTGMSDSWTLVSRKDKKTKKGTQDTTENDNNTTQTTKLATKSSKSNNNNSNNNNNNNNTVNADNTKKRRVDKQAKPATSQDNNNNTTKKDSQRRDTNFRHNKDQNSFHKKENKQAEEDKQEKVQKEKRKYHFVDLEKLETLDISNSIFTKERPSENDYDIPSIPLQIPDSIPPLKALAMIVFVKELQDNPRENIPALISLPEEYIHTIVAMLAPHRVEVRVALHEYQFRHNNTEGNDKINYITLRQVLESITDFELRFLSYQKKHDSHKYLKTLESNLIDVWANFDTFKLRPATNEEDKIFSFYYGTSPPYRPPAGSLDEPSISQHGTFMRRFKIFTNGMFEGWKEWKNMVVVGGSVQACLVHIPKQFSETDEKLFEWFHRKRYVQSDVDICLYGLNDQQFTDKVYELYNFLKAKTEVMIIRTRYTVTLCTKWPQRHIQIVLARWGSIQELIQESDVDCSAVAFDGTKVWTTQRGRMSYNYRSVIATQKAYQSRGNPEYEGRLMKFSRRGFYIWDMDFQWKMMSDRFLHLGKEYILQLRDMRIIGLRLLLCGLKFAKEIWDGCDLYDKENEGKPYYKSETTAKVRSTFTDKDRFFKDGGIPYGPYWTIKRIKDHVNNTKYPSDYYGYVVSTANVFQVISNVRNEKSIISFNQPRRYSYHPEHNRGRDDYTRHQELTDEMMTPKDLGHVREKWHDHLLVTEDIHEIYSAYYWKLQGRHVNDNSCPHNTAYDYCVMPADIGGYGYGRGAEFKCTACFKLWEVNPETEPGKYVYKLHSPEKRPSSKDIYGDD